MSKMIMLFYLTKVSSLNISVPTKFGFRRRSNQFYFAGHCVGEPGCVDFGQRMFKAYDW